MRRAAILTLLFAAPVVAMLPSFFRWIEDRHGFRPHEPLLDHLPPTDLSVPLFVVLYGAISMALVVLVRHPARLLRGAQAYILLLLLRMITMALWTLEPPPGLIDLTDPFTQIFYPGEQPFRKDLFFSGHTATIVLLALAVPTRRGRFWLGLAAAFIGMAVLVQHVHWTVDVVAAPVFAWLAWSMSAITFRYTVPKHVNGADA